MFNPNELQTIISGAETNIDIEDMRTHTSYSGNAGFFLSINLLRSWTYLSANFLIVSILFLECVFSIFLGGYDNQHAIIDMFWQAVSEFSEEEKRKLLLFTTSCSRPPILGFKVQFFMSIVNRLLLWRISNIIKGFRHILNSILLQFFSHIFYPRSQNYRSSSWQYQGDFPTFHSSYFL